MTFVTVGRERASGPERPPIKSNLCMTDDEMQHIAERRFEGDSLTLEELRRDPETATVLDALD